MIRTGTILDMDMTGLGAAVRSGWDWWTDELSRLVPEGWQARPQTVSGPFADYYEIGAENGQIWLDGAVLDPVADGVRRRLMHVRLPASAVMARRAMLPRLAARDLAPMVALELDRLLPFPPGTAIAAARSLPDEAEPGHSKVPTLVAGMPLARAVAAVDAARLAGIEPLGLIWQSDDDSTVTLDLLPALVASGRITPRRDGRAFWWGLVAALFVANLGLMIWRDVAATNAFADEVAAQQATSTAARAIATRIGTEAALRKALIAERAEHDPLALLALTTAALPQGAWVQRYVWTPATLRLTGYKAPGSDIQAALRRSGRFASLQTSVSDPTAEGGGGQPFDVSAAIAPAIDAPGKAAPAVARESGQ